MKQPLSLALCQIKVTPDKEKNIQNALKFIAKAAAANADIAILPEIFNGPYDSKIFPQYAEEYPGPSTEKLARAAKQNRIAVVAGSVIEKVNSHLYNSSFVFDHQGELLARHRKIHLFDVDMPGRIYFKESLTLSAGSDITLFEYKNIKFGLMVCYDCRFPELARILAMEGAQVIIMPGNFNLTSGPLFWELMLRTRAVDNQVYMVGVSAARNEKPAYQSWGHSMVTDPWGRVLVEGDEKEIMLLSTIDIAETARAREEMPLLKHRRIDLYKLDY
ncbi:MAG: carbon-nitrogen hydrolase family protein [Syntrophomonadaceae bacterium]|nr:carbon-nitrogen hydrolase family protein [Syntrophomonadaceae bacterium]